MTNHHPTPEALEQFLLGLLAPTEMREVARHLVDGCLECQDVTTTLWEPADVFEDPMALAAADLSDEGRDDYDEVLDRVFDRVVAAEASLLGEQALAARLHNELLQCPAERRHLLLTNCQRFSNRLLCERLIDDSFEAGFNEPHQAIDAGRLAVLLAGHLTPEQCGGGDAVLAGLRARAWAHLGNAYRIGSDFDACEQAFAEAEALLSEGGISLIERARVLTLLASWRRVQSRFGEALQLCDRVAAIYKKLGQWSLLGRTLLKKSVVCGEAGDGEEEMKLLRRALDLIDPQTDSRTFLAARHNLIIALHDSGRSREAFALLFHTRPLYLKTGDRMSLLKLRWLEGLVAFGLQRLDQAEAAFREVREAFVEMEVGYDAALASLDLAGVYILQGRTADVRWLAEETLAVFQAHHTHREALAALLTFCNAARSERVELDLVREVSSSLKRARNQPDSSSRPS
ncbi:MAG: tetratricopeptide repeat protein [Thermoanaerobaculia bacterium]